MSKKIVIITFTILLLFLMAIPQIVLAINTDTYTNIYSPSTDDINEINTIGGKILGVVQVVGMTIAVIMLIVIGIKYMIASAQEKSQLKDTLLPYVIGAILLFGGSNLLTIIVQFVMSLYN